MRAAVARKGSASVTPVLDRVRGLDDAVGLGDEHRAPQRARGAVEEPQALEVGRVGGHGPADDDGVVRRGRREGGGEGEDAGHGSIVPAPGGKHK